MSRAFLVACLLTLVAGNALAQSFPAKPLTLICPCQPGNIPDQYTRAMASIAAKYLGQPVAVENKPGELQTLGTATMAGSARPDGYSLSMQTVDSFRVPHMRRVFWDPLKDVTYIIGLAGTTFGIAVRSDSPIKTLEDLIAHAKANPGRLNYGLSGRGSTPYLAMEELGLKSGARFLHVPGPDVEAARPLLKGEYLRSPALRFGGRTSIPAPSACL